MRLFIILPVTKGSLIVRLQGNDEEEEQKYIKYSVFMGIAQGARESLFMQDQVFPSTKRSGSVWVSLVCVHLEGMWRGRGLKRAQRCPEVGPKRFSVTAPLK